jgi:hypothetical protein
VLLILVMGGCVLTGVLMLFCQLPGHTFFIHSFSVNPVGSTNSCGCGNRPSLQYNKNNTSCTILLEPKAQFLCSLHDADSSVLKHNSSNFFQFLITG